MTPNSNLIASVRQRLLNLRSVRGEDYNAILTQYVVERFLYRLSKSRLAQQFVLKGAMPFRAWSGQLHRPTKDLDLLGYGASTLDAVAQAVRDVWVAPVPDDGLTFDPATVVASDIREEQEYGGVRVRLVAMLGNARIPMQIDVGFGDAVTPSPVVQAFPTLLEMDAPYLRMYPPETVVAEKLEAAVTRGMVNSRMKDYYDLLVISRTHHLIADTLAKAIAATFKRRGTVLPNEIPPGLSDEFGNDNSAGRLWREFLRRLQINDAPGELNDVIRSVRERYWPAIVKARRMMA
jgi:hypothetical protein